MTVTVEKAGLRVEKANPHHGARGRFTDSGPSIVQAIVPRTLPSSVTRGKTQNRSTSFSGPRGSIAHSSDPQGHHRLRVRLKGAKPTDRKDMTASQAKTALSFAVRQIAA